MVGQLGEVALDLVGFFYGLFSGIAPIIILILIIVLILTLFATFVYLIKLIAK